MAGFSFCIKLLFVSYLYFHYIRAIIVSFSKLFRMANPKFIYYFSLNSIPISRCTNFKWLFETIKSNLSLFNLSEIPHYATLVAKVRANEVVILHKTESKTYTFTREPLLQKALKSGEFKYEATLF